MKHTSEKEILARLSMSGKRLAHTLAVAKECEALAKIFALSEDDAEKLKVAALLHDCTKELKGDDQVKLCEKFGIPYTREDVESPKVFHAMTGAATAEVEFGADADVVRAIRSHTTGSEDMSLLDKLLYLADYIEETRTWDDCVELRRVFYHAVKSAKKPLGEILDDTLILSFDMTIRNLLEESACVHSQTIRSRNALVRARKNSKQ